MNLLKKLEIDVLPPERRFLSVKKGIIGPEEHIFFAYLYEQNSEFSELISIFTAKTEEKLREELIKNGYEYLTKRTYENFVKWYGKIGGNLEDVEMARDKFKN